MVSLICKFLMITLFVIALSGLASGLVWYDYADIGTIFLCSAVLLAGIAGLRRAVRC